MPYTALTEDMVQEHVIFYVDDDPDDRQLLSRALNSIDNNYIIIEAQDGEEAITTLRQLKTKGTLPSLIVLDINMPKIDGKQTYIAIRSDEALAGIPIIIFSTSNSEMDQLFFKRRNTEYIVKPSDYAHIEEVAARMLKYCKTA